MKIKLTEGRAASQEAIAALEAELGCWLSDSFKAFVQTYDGAKPETNFFKIGDKNESGVRRFIPVDEIRDERAHIEYFPQKKAYPVAEDGLGNYVFIDEGKDGAVFFWDHYPSEESIQLATNFAAFLGLLDPFDIKSIKLKPGQVKRVWLDPEFLKCLKEK
jgi:hypothetical protein